MVLFLFSRPFLEVHLNGRMQATLVAITVSWQQDSRLAKVKKQHLAPGENGGKSWWGPISLESIPMKKCFFWKTEAILDWMFCCFWELFVFFWCTKWWGLHKLARQKSQAAYERLLWKKWPNIFMGLSWGYFTLLLGSYRSYKFFTPCITCSWAHLEEWMLGKWL